MGPYNFAPYYIDRDEVTNRAYQEFVDGGGYEKPEYWPASFTRDGRQVSWETGMAEFHDSTGRPGPSTWAAGHYPDGRADDPVSGVSWFEAAAFAKFAGKELPVLGAVVSGVRFRCVGVHGADEQFEERGGGGGREISGFGGLRHV